MQPNPLAAQSKAQIYCLSLAGIAVSNPVGGMAVSLSCEYCVLSLRGLLVGPITHS